MRISTLLFTLGLVVVLVAFFDFPFPHFVDRWLLVVVGAFISFFSYTLINEERKVKTHASPKIVPDIQNPSPANRNEKSLP
jgi:purine-cytosine permease-like protein